MFIIRRDSTNKNFKIQFILLRIIIYMRALQAFFIQENIFKQSR